MSTITVLDGGMGRQLMAMGAPFRQPEWSALTLWEDPDAVVRAHRSFVDAGAQVITTNSYAIVPFHIGEERFAADGALLAARSGELARRAATGAVLVAGSLPPLFGSYRPDLFDATEAPRIIDPLVQGLAPFVDLWLGETLASIAEARAVRDAIDRHDVGDRPLWISFTLDDEHPGTVRSGERVSEAAAAAVELGADALLFNCCAPDTITIALEQVSHLAGTVQLGGYANRFVSHSNTGGAANEGLSDLRSDLDPATYAGVAARWVDLGASIIGGCCGIGPEHLHSLQTLTGA